jgi:glycosyltransferase involved in cell wall biosynthesis
MEVEKHHWSLEKQAVDLATSDIGLAPLPDNRFTRGKCGFKILQYEASGLPAIASPVGVNAEYVSDGVTGFHASSNSEWIDRISMLVKNPQMRRQMGQAGRTKVEKFDLRIVGNQLVKLIKTNINRADDA